MCVAGLEIEDGLWLAQPHRVHHDEESDAENSSKKGKAEEVRTKYDRMFERRNQDVLSGHYTKLIAGDSLEKEGSSNEDSDEDDGFLSIKRVIPVGNENSSDDGEVDSTASGPATKVISGIGKEPLVIDSKRKEKLLKSKKKLLKLKEKGTKLIFDDDGVAHQMYELENEADFNRRGPAEDQRVKFLGEEAARVREADLDDKALAKEKKREKREKRKARERGERDVIEEEEAPELVQAEDDHDPLALLASLPLADDDDDQEDRPPKRSKKWFEEDSDGEEKVVKRKARVIEAEDEPETLEDLEALAAGLLN